MEADTESHLRDHLVRVFVVDPVFDGPSAGYVEVGGMDLSYVGQGCLSEMVRKNVKYVFCRDSQANT